MCSRSTPRPRASSASWWAGSAPVACSYEPNVSTIVRSSGGKRFHVLMSSREARGMITDVLVLKDSVIAKNPKMVEGLIRGTLDGLAFMAANPAKAAEIIAKTLDISPRKPRSNCPISRIRHCRP